MIPLGHYLVLSALVFAMGVVGIFLNRKNLIILLMAIELMLLAVNINFVAFSHFLHDLVGQVFAMFVLTLRAREDVRRQKIAIQIARARRETIELVKVRSGEGV